MTTILCMQSKLSSLYEGLMKTLSSTKNGSITRPRFTLCWSRRTNLGNYLIGSRRASTEHLRVMGSAPLLLNYVTTLCKAGKDSAFWSGERQLSYQSDRSFITFFFCRKHIYGLARDLHRVGIVHGDLEPRNVARVPGGGFLLIDFSESVRKHNCKEILVRYMATSCY